MWPQTELTQQLKTMLPIIQAPMAGGMDSIELASAVSNNGALGSLGMGYLSPDEMKATILAMQQLTDQPFAVNLFVPSPATATEAQIAKEKEIVALACQELHCQIRFIHPSFAFPFVEQMQIMLETNVPVFSFTFGIPTDDWLIKFKKREVILMGTATNLAEATLLAQKGVNIIVAQGSEAGGHRGTFLGKEEDSLLRLEALLPAIVKQVTIPVVAAGGIMDGKGIVSAMELGAAGVQMGTAFLSCPESGILPQFKTRLLQLRSDQTTLTRVFSGKLARGIKNLFIERMLPYADTVLDYPLQNELTKAMRATAKKQANLDFLSLWAGQAAHLSRGLPAGKLLQVLDEEVKVQLAKKIAAQ